MIRRILCLWLLAWPLALQAQTVSFRTGEHADFTRIVAFTPPDADWQIGRDISGYVLRLPGVVDYDLDGFFDLIPRERILDAAPGEAAEDLQLTVDCICHIKAFRLRPTVLVIDVMDGPAPRISPFELALPSTAISPAMPSPAPLPALPRYQVQGNRLLSLMPGGDPVPSSKVTTVPQAAPPASDTNSSVQEVDALAQAVTQSLARGLTAGVLAPAAPVPPAADGADPLVDLQTSIAALPGLNTRSSTDPLADPTVTPPNTTQTGGACVPDEFFRIGTWADDRPFYNQIAPARRAVVKATGVTDDSAVAGLAKVYLYFGFGREAVQTLATDGVESRERQYLRLIGQLIDADPVPVLPFIGQVSCAGPVALWALLAQDQPPVDAQVNRSSVVRAFRALPRPVQDAIKARLSERFLQIGDLDGASQILNRYAQKDDATTETALAAANLAAALGEDDAARQAVAQITRDDPRANPAAMIRFLEDGINAGAVFTEADFLLADALRFEHAGSDQAAALTEAQIRALTAADQFVAARDMLDEHDEILSSAPPQALRTALWQRAATRMQDAEFLAMVWGEKASNLGPEAQNAVAERLLSIGFPERAQTVLGGDNDDPDDIARSLLHARIALAFANPDAALARLAPLMEPEAEDLRAQARAMQRTIQLDAGNLNAILAVPEDPVRQNDTLLQDAAALVVIPDPGALSADLPLTEGRALLERSAQSRATLDALLEASNLPADF